MTRANTPRVLRIPVGYQTLTPSDSQPLPWRFVDVTSFLGLEATGDPCRWRLPVSQGVCSGVGALFGGAGLGAAVQALEETTGRRCVWAVAQYLSFARPPSVVDLELVEAKVGGSVTQARVVARVDGEEIFTVNAALGDRREKHVGEWATKPAVPPPDECPPRIMMSRHEGTITERLDARLADARRFEDLDGTPAPGGCSSLWVRIPELGSHLGTTAAALAIVGDFVPFGVSQALGRPVGGTSLDNSLRLVHRIESEWVLADIRIQAAANGFAHGALLLWSRSGSFLGQASQTVVVRSWR